MDLPRGILKKMELHPTGIELLDCFLLFCELGYRFVFPSWDRLKSFKDRESDAFVIDFRILSIEHRNGQGSQVLDVLIDRNLGSENGFQPLGFVLDVDPQRFAQRLPIDVRNRLDLCELLFRDFSQYLDGTRCKLQLTSQLLDPLSTCWSQRSFDLLLIEEADATERPIRRIVLKARLGLVSENRVPIGIGDRIRPTGDHAMKIWMFL